LTCELFFRFVFDMSVILSIRFLHLVIKSVGWFILSPRRFLKTCLLFVCIFLFLWILSFPYDRVWIQTFRLK
jgi:hypothetical protein